MQMYLYNLTMLWRKFMERKCCWISSCSQRKI